MNDKNCPADLSYFRLSLLAFLSESHPQLANDEKFINARAQAALDAYEQAVQNGGNPFSLARICNSCLKLTHLHRSQKTFAEVFLFSEQRCFHRISKIFLNSINLENFTKIVVVDK